MKLYLFILMLLMAITVRAQTAIDSNFDNPFSRLNRFTLSGEKSTMYSKLKNSIKARVSKQASVLPLDTLELKKISSIKVDSSSYSKFLTRGKNYKDSILNELGQSSHLSSLNITNKIESGKSKIDDIDSLVLRIEDTTLFLESRQILIDEIDTAKLEQYYEKSFSSFTNNYFDQSIDSLLGANELMQVDIPDSVSATNPLDLVSQFRGESFSQEYVDHFGDYKESVTAAADIIRKKKFSDNLKETIQGLVKNDFTNDIESPIKKWSVSSFFGYNDSGQEIVLKPMVGFNLSDRWSVGFIQGLAIPLNSSQRLRLDESGFFTQYDISKFFIHIEWQSTSLMRNDTRDVNDKLLFGIGRELTLKSIPGNILLLYDTSNNQPNKFSFRYGISIF